jgi:hypothetical protein
MPMWLATEKDNVVPDADAHKDLPLADGLFRSMFSWFFSRIAYPDDSDNIFHYSV